MDIQRTVTLSVFFISAFLLWDAWQKQHLPSPPIQTPTVASTPQPGQPGAASAPSPAPALVPPAASPQQASALPAGIRVHVSTDKLSAEIDTVGGDLRNVTLVEHRGEEDQSGPLVLMRDKGEPYYVTQSGLLGNGLPTHNTLYAAEATSYQLGAAQEKMEVRLSAPEANGVKVTKVYTFHRGTYLIDVAYEISNSGDATLAPKAYFLFLRDGNAPPVGGKVLNMFTGPTNSFTGPALYTNKDKFEKVGFSEIDKRYKNDDESKRLYRKEANDGWIGMVQHYFVAAWLPQGNVEREFYIDRVDGKFYRAGVELPVGTVQPGKSTSISMPLYVGPQEVDKLVKLAPGLDLVVDYGIFTLIAAPIFRVLQFIHNWVHNWGVAIILLTVLIKLIFFPLQNKASRSMAQMKILAPKMQKLKEQYGDDRQKLQQATMELYKKEKINPLGGCLPIVIQIPVFISLYWVLLASVELRHAPFALWIKDLSGADPYFVLPVIYAVTMFVQMKLQPVSPDPVQQKVMMAMPIVFSVMFLVFPAGLVLYWIVNNVLTIAQQWYINRSMEAENAAKVNAKR